MNMDIKATLENGTSPNEILAQFIAELNRTKAEMDREKIRTAEKRREEAEKMKELDATRSTLIEVFADYMEAFGIIEHEDKETAKVELLEVLKDCEVQFQKYKEIADTIKGAAIPIALPVKQEKKECPSVRSFCPTENEDKVLTDFLAQILG